ncbi:hypothetical protein [Streptomyces sp. NPDC014623]
MPSRSFLTRWSFLPRSTCGRAGATTRTLLRLTAAMLNGDS